MKKSIFSFFVLLSFFVFPMLSVSASSVELPPVPEATKQYVIAKVNDTSYLLSSFESIDGAPVDVDFYFENGSLNVKSKNGNVIHRNYSYTVGSGYWVNTSGTQGSGFILGGNFSSDRIIYNSSPVYKDSSKSEVLIEKKFIPVPKVPMAEQIKGIKMEEALKVVVEIAPIVVLSIVSYLGLRKAWSFCLDQLRSS